MKKQIRIIIVLLFGILLIFGHQLLAKMNYSRRPQGVDRKVTELMIIAMQARDAGDHANAELFWMHARELKPSLKRPAWLDAIDSPGELHLSDDDVMRRVMALPYAQAKDILEQQIRKSPENQKLRTMYLELAHKNSDLTQEKRHKSLSEEPEIDAKSMVIRFIILLIVIVLLAWQLWAFLDDYRNKRLIDPDHKK